MGDVALRDSLLRRNALSSEIARVTTIEACVAGGGSSGWLHPNHVEIRSSISHKHGIFFPHLLDAAALPPDLFSGEIPLIILSITSCT
jgi:hypothetical protein